MLIHALHIMQAGIAAYGAQPCYIAIDNLRTYEKTTEKIAKISNEAERQLWNSRTTMTAGSVSLLVSFVMSLLLASHGYKYGFVVQMFASPTMTGVLFLARAHIQDIWAGADGKTVGPRLPLPKMSDYNQAQQKIEELLQILNWLMLSWGATSIAAIIEGY